MQNASSIGLNVARVYAHTTDPEHPFQVSLIVFIPRPGPIVPLIHNLLLHNYSAFQVHQSCRGLMYNPSSLVNGGSQMGSVLESASK